MPGLIRRFADRLRSDADNEEVARLRAELAQYRRGWPPGHFYSPIPSLEEVRARESAIFAVPDAIPGIDLNDAGQRALFDRLAPLASDHPFPETRTDGRRFFFDNPNFRHGEALIMFALLRHLMPKRMVEVGSGHSTCVMVDTNEAALGGAMAMSCIEPYPELLRSLLKTGDEDRLRIIAEPVQDVSLELFTELEDGDVLFIDSSHVSKTGSDVNFLYFEVLPRLRNGVWVHVHDVPYPFQYPAEWVMQGRAWNEVYLLRALLMHSRAFRIEFFNSYFARFHPDQAAAIPLYARSPGSSIWLRKIAD